MQTVTKSNKNRSQFCGCLIELPQGELKERATQTRKGCYCLAWAIAVESVLSNTLHS
jgi:hypothetical protein